MEKFKISDIQELFAADVERFHSLTQLHVSELLRQVPPPQESLDEALRQTHTLKGLAGTVEAWGLASLGADLEKLLELAGSWMQNDPEKAQDIFQFIIDRQQDWFVMNQFTCMDMLPEAWDIYAGLRGLMEERWPGYLPEASPAANGDHQFVRLDDLDLDAAASAATQPVPDLDVQSAASLQSEVNLQKSDPRPPASDLRPLTSALPTPAPLHVVPPVLRQRAADRSSPGETPAGLVETNAQNLKSGNAETISTSQPVSVSAFSPAALPAPATPKPLQVVPPPLKSKGQQSKVRSQQSEVSSPDSAATPPASAAPENLAPVLPPTVAQSMTPPASAASSVPPVAEAGRAAPPILRVAPPTLKRRGKKGATTLAKNAENLKSGNAETISASEPVSGSAFSPAALPPVAEVSSAPGESAAAGLASGQKSEGRSQTSDLRPLLSAHSQPASEPAALPAPTHGAAAEHQPAESKVNVPPVVEQITISEVLAIDQASTGPLEDDTALFAPPPLSPEEVAGQSVAAHLGEGLSQPVMEQDLLELLGQEVAGYLSELTALLAELAANLAESALWEKTRRLFHTIKGTAATFHLDAISAPAKAAEAHCIVAVEDAHGRSREAFETCVHRAALVAKGLGLPFNEGPLRLALEVGLARTAMQATHSAGPSGPVAGPGLDPEMAGFFIRDAQDQIEVIEQALVRWEKLEARSEKLEAGSPNSELLSPISQLQAAQRGFHTIKGAGNSIGLSAVAQSVHEVEEFLEQVAAVLENGNQKSVVSGLGSDLRHVVAAPKGLFAFLFGAVDQLRAYLAALAKDTAALWRNDWSTALRLLREPVAGGQKTEVSGQQLDLRAPTSDLRVLTPALVVEGREEDADSHTLRIDAERLYGLMNLIGEMVVDRSRLARKIEVLSGLQRELAERNAALSGAVLAFQREFEFNLLQQKNAGGASSSSVGQGQSRSAGGHEFSELEFDRYDQFNVLARSLVEVSHDIEVLNGEVAVCLDGFTAENVQFARTSQALQNKVTSLSLVPVSSLFARLQRAFRDALSVEGKAAELVLAGGEALLDKVVVDRVYAPLLHLLRNAVAHGIEGAGVRERLKKPARGVVRLSAAQLSNQIVIQIADDGAGVDAQAVRRRAIEKGWLPQEAPELSPEQVVHFIFQPGFSTAAKVTSVSGRGIGLDVVRKEVEGLNGSVELRYEALVGSTWTLRLPLTLSISEAILAEVGGASFAFPLNFIESGLVLDAPTSCRADGREVFEIVTRQAAGAAGSPRETTGGQPALHEQSSISQGESAGPVSEWLPVVRLCKLFQMSGDEAATKGLIVSVGDRRAILVVDVVLARQEIVIKQLDSVLALHPLLNGATLDAEGRVIPILNLPTLLKFGENAVNEVGHRPAAPRPGAKAGQLRVLIVDDSLSVRKVQERYLTELGCKVTVAADGLIALERLREQDFDFVFTDLEMPRMNGYELISELHGNPVWASMPIVVISSRGADKYITKAMNLGATTFLSKPFTQEQLKQVLEHYAKAAQLAVA